MARVDLGVSVYNSRGFAGSLRSAFQRVAQPTLIAEVPSPAIGDVLEPPAVWRRCQNRSVGPSDGLALGIVRQGDRALGALRVALAGADLVFACALEQR